MPIDIQNIHVANLDLKKTYLEKRTYVDHLAILAYTDRKAKDKKNNGTSALGVLLADELAGLWMGHTIPGLIDLTKSRAEFPERESANGHLIMCLSLDLLTLNQVTMIVKDIAPTFTINRIPKNLISRLPAWDYTNRKQRGKRGKRNETKYTFTFNTQGSELRVTALIRKPGDKRCLFELFAKEKGIVMDVYGHRKHKKPICKEKFGVRHINSISVKSLEFVSYVNYKNDRAGFGVSTISKNSSSTRQQYWTCIHNFDNGEHKATLVMCVDNFNIWASFDTLKVKEPECL